MKKIINIIILIVVFCGFSQAKDFKDVDRYALSVKKSKDYRQLAKKLAEPFSLEVDKARAIFVWIAHNIKYDVKKRGKKGRTKITGKSKKEIEIKKRKLKLKRIQKAYTSEKGVCEDYSLLFIEMCKAVGLEAVYVNGYAKFGREEIGKIPNSSNHAWNAIKINGKWELIDVTWAAGTVDFKRNRFVKEFSDFFFLADPGLFIFNHFPNDPKWQLLSKKVGKKEFASLPYLHSSFYKYGVKNFSPHNAYVKRNSIIKLQLNRIDEKLGLYISERPTKKKYTVPENGKVEIKLPNSIRRNQSIIIGVKKNKKFLPLIEYRGA